MYKMDEEIKKNLSKYKYVYRIYKDSGVIADFHIEKYPIVYINEEVVYFKGGRKNWLTPITFNTDMICIDKVAKTSYLEAVEYINNKFIRCPWIRYDSTSVYFIDMNKIDSFDLSLIKKYFKEENKKFNIEQAEKEVEKYKRLYEKSLKELEDIKKGVK